MIQTKLDVQLAALATMSPAQLRADWKLQSSQDLPNAPASLLRQLIAYRLQEKKFGKLPVQNERQLDQIVSGLRQGEYKVGMPAIGGTNARHAPILHGTRFIREWNGKTIAVTVTQGGGFEWEGETYRSLSEIARKVTGARWSGPRFFGLKAGQG
jgi:Protein of unknown function (DUF2924)